MVDVARLAGVSQQTVSRVVNGHSNVAPDIKDRVEAAMSQLRYRRNSAARALATSRSMNLGVLSYALSVHGPALALFGIAEEARQHGYSTSLVSIAKVDHASIRAGLDSLVEGGVDAIIVLAPMTAATEVLRRLDADVPVVRFEQGAPAGPATVSIDETLGAQLATRHLLERGHSTVHFVGGPSGWMASEARRRGWQTELALAGRPIPAEIPSTDWSAESGYRAGMHIAADRSITAVLAINDVIALGVMKALHDSGLSIPGDVSVVGFDDRDESAYFQPALTTVRLDFTEIGRRAVESVLGALQGEPAATIPLVQPELRVRESTGPASRAFLPRG
ncbi:MAG: LacI family transcriptional regulator [Microbacterium sp.]|jgi:DNA-binding LacI/PurR family transcriptional regulator|nr:LacI family transcriptional regulator [Microbacterium sp.]